MHVHRMIKHMKLDYRQQKIYLIHAIKENIVNMEATYMKLLFSSCTTACWIRVVVNINYCTSNSIS